MSRMSHVALLLMIIISSASTAVMAHSETYFDPDLTAETVAIKTQFMKDPTTVYPLQTFVADATAAWVQLPSPIREGLSCDSCKLIVGLLSDIVENRTTLNYTTELLIDAVCVRKLNGSSLATCEKLVQLVAEKALPSLWQGFQSLAWNIPLTVCADVAKVCRMPCCETNTVPEQLHLSFATSTDVVTSMRVTWVTLNATSAAMVRWGTGSQSWSSFEDPTRTYTSGGWLGLIHSAVMSGLEWDTAYWYAVGSDADGWSTNYTFQTIPRDLGEAGRPLRLATIADMGYGPNSNNTVQQITAMVDRGEIHAVLHYGDISYADGDEMHWDVFFRKIEPIAARVPYLMTPGNHEMWWNFSAYKARAGLAMPPAAHGIPRDAMYYHIKMGTVHLLMLDGETWLDTPDIDPDQVAWVKTVGADHPVSHQLPWLLAVHHRPLYCTQGHDVQCGLFSHILRSQVEDTYNALGVDVGLAGHMHEYERTWPVKAGQVVSKSYNNSGAPMYITNGAAGNREGNSPPDLGRPWSVTGTGAVGFAVFEFTSWMTTGHHQLNITFYRSRDMEALDNVVITKDL